MRSPLPRSIGNIAAAILAVGISSTCGIQRIGHEVIAAEIERVDTAIPIEAPIVSIDRGMRIASIDSIEILPNTTILIDETREIAITTIVA